MEMRPISHNVLEKLTNSLASLTPGESIIALVEVPTESETLQVERSPLFMDTLFPDQSIFQLSN